MTDSVEPKGLVIKYHRGGGGEGFGAKQGEV